MIYSIFLHKFFISIPYTKGIRSGIEKRGGGMLWNNGVRISLKIVINRDGCTG
jgi:hypothetical protein